MTAQNGRRHFEREEEWVGRNSRNHIAGKEEKPSKSANYRAKAVGRVGLRIVAGEWGGRTIEAPKGADTRPTSERVREAVFSSLQGSGKIEGARVLDLYAGSGAMALEALSRGAKSAALVEPGSQAKKIVEVNIRKLQCADRAKLLPVTDVKALAIMQEDGTRFDLAFVDPPYNAGRYEWALKTLPQVLANAATVVCEHPVNMPLPTFEGYEVRRYKAYGDTAISIFEWRTKEETE